MSENASQLVWESEDEELAECYLSGFTIAEVDEKFAKAFPDCTVVAIMLVGEYVSLREEEEV